MPLDHDVFSIVAYVGSTQERGRNIYFCMGILKQTVLIMLIICINHTWDFQVTSKSSSHIPRPQRVKDNELIK